MIIVNGYFRSQAISGQQRYAHEIADRLPALVPALVELGPRWSRRSRYGQWLELQTRLPIRSRRSTLLSLTSRTPLHSPGQVVTIHDLFPLTHPEWFSSSYAALHRGLLRHHLRNAAGFVVVSEPVAEQLRDALRRDAPVVVAPNAATADLADANQSELVIPARFFLAVGNLEPRKNLARLIEAHGLLPADLRAAYPLLVVGGEAAAFRSDVDLGSGGRSTDVEFLGRVSDADLAALYRGATAYVSVSLAEGFGLPVVEAAAAGTGHLVLSDLPVYRWVVGSDAAVFVDPASKASIADGLLATTRMPPLHAERRMADRFSWDVSARAVAELLRVVDGA